MSDTPSVEDGESCCPTLSPKARYIGFVACLALGIAISFFHLFGIFKPSTDFAVWITVGDVLILGSSLFISSPKAQWKKLMHPLRATTTIILLASIACTLVFLMLPGKLFKILGIVAAVVQYCSMFWYVLSLIPGGQKCCTACLNSCGATCCDCVKGAANSA